MRFIRSSKTIQPRNLNCIFIYFTTGTKTPRGDAQGLAAYDLVFGIVIMKTKIALLVAVCLACQTLVGCSSMCTEDENYSGRLGLSSTNTLERGPNNSFGNVASMPGDPGWITPPTGIR
jgi:hypothetical protein